MVFRSEEEGWQEVSVPIVNASVGLQTSDIVKKRKKNPPIYLYSAVVHVWPCVCQGIRRQRRLQLLFLSFGLKWKSLAGTRNGVKSGKEKGMDER